jgi:hypothetical protein
MNHIEAIPTGLFDEHVHVPREEESEKTPLLCHQQG